MEDDTKDYGSSYGDPNPGVRARFGSVPPEKLDPDPTKIPGSGSTALVAGHNPQSSQVCMVRIM